jgi:hypothetical protein
MMKTDPDRPSIWGVCFFAATISGSRKTTPEKKKNKALIPLAAICYRTSVLVAKKHDFSLKKQGFAENKSKKTIAIQRQTPYTK